MLITFHSIKNKHLEQHVNGCRPAKLGKRVHYIEDILDGLCLLDHHICVVVLPAAGSSPEIWLQAEATEHWMAVSLLADPSFQQVILRPRKITDAELSHPKKVLALHGLKCTKQYKFEKFPSSMDNVWQSEGSTNR